MRRFSLSKHALVPPPARVDESGLAGRMRAVETENSLLAQANLAAAEVLREARKSERLYRAMGESIDYGVWVCDPDGRNTYASESFLKLVGLTQEQCSRFGWGAALHPEERERTLARWNECVRTGGVWDIEHRYLGVDGQWHHILSRGVPVRDEGGRICCWAGINLDINRQKHLEAALKREAGRKDDFLALLGHELRNPLAPISLAVDLIRAAGRDPAAIEPACAIVERQVAHMVRLVDDLLDVARIARGKFQLRKDVIDLAAAVRGVLEDYRPVFAENGLALETELAPGPVWMEADKARITQAVSNLLHNAIKFTDRGGRVAVTLAVEEGAWAQVRVRDTGIGIPPDLLPSMFEPFMQNQATIGRARGGLGLGLALIKGLVAMHGGTVSAMSEGPGMGSGFTLRLPVRRAQAGPAPEAPAPGGPVPVPGRPRRILIVEDFQDAAITLKRLLELQGHTVAIAADGRTGLDLADSFGPEIILCDIGLPGQLDGYGVARAIREAPRLKDIYLVALTGFGTPEDKVKAIRAGFDLHLTKPVAPVALERLILGIPQVGAWRLRTCSATPTGSAPATP